MLFALVAWACFAAFQLPGIQADDDADEPNLGDQDVPFAEKVNEAIDLGTKWLLSQGTVFPIPGNRDGLEGIHYGFIVGETLYQGGMGEGYGHPAGTTALAMYTLLKCGVPPEHPIIDKGFNWLREPHQLTTKWSQNEAAQVTWTHAESGSSYEVSAMILALCAKYEAKKKTGKASRKKLKIGDAADADWMAAMVEGLASRRGLPVEDAPAEERRGWRYNQPEVKRSIGGRGRSSTWTRPAGGLAPHANQDLSSTQLAALALYNAQRFGFEVDPEVWEDIALLTLASQETEGPEHERHDPRAGGAPKMDVARGFMYIPDSPAHSEGVASSGMTACGLANLIMADDMLSHHKKASKEYVGSNFQSQVQKGMADALAWLDRNWSPFANRPTGTYHIYYLYGLERAMDMLGRNLVGKRLWYQEGAQQLLARLQRAEAEVPDAKMRRTAMPAGFWDTKSSLKPTDVLDTCFALLFLKRATLHVMPPVVTGD